MSTHFSDLPATSAAELDSRLAALVDGAAQAPALARRLTAAGLSTADISTRAGLAALPVQSKDDVIREQELDPPFGGMLRADVRIARVFQSPGPIYEPQVEGGDPWRWAPSLEAVGVGSDDVVLNCFGYHLSPAGAMFDEACRALGASVVPGGIGATELQARAVQDLPITAYTGLPSYLNALIEKYDDLGLAPDAWGLTKALVTAEPLPDSLRDQLRRRVPTVLAAYGTAETGLLAYEDSPGSGMVVAPDVIIEICDLDSGQPLTEGPGEVVVTVLRAEYPLIRFGTGDLSAWQEGPDGRARLAGVLGRVGQAVKVRGMFLHPAQAGALVGSIPGVAAHRFVVDQADHRDRLSCEIVLADGADPTETAAQVTHRVRDGLRFRCEVVTVAELPAGAPAIDDRRDWS